MEYMPPRLIVRWYQGSTLIRGGEIVAEPVAASAKGTLYVTASETDQSFAAAYYT